MLKPIKPKDVESTFSVECYGKTYTYAESQREAVKSFFAEAAECSDGCERERYLNIYMLLAKGSTYASDL